MPHTAPRTVSALAWWLTESARTALCVLQLGNLTSLRELTLFSNAISGSLPRELGHATELRALRLNEMNLTGNLTALDTIGKLKNLVTLDVYNNSMHSEVPPQIEHLTALKYLFVDQRHLRPLTQGWCQYRFPNFTHIGRKYNFIDLRENYREYVNTVCDEPYSIEFAFNPLQVSRMYPD